MFKSIQRKQETVGKKISDQNYFIIQQMSMQTLLNMFEK